MTTDYNPRHQEDAERYHSEKHLSNEAIKARVRGAIADELGKKQSKKKQTHLDWNFLLNTKLFNRWI